MLIKLSVRPLGNGAFEARPWDGIKANDLLSETRESGVNKSYAPVLFWGSLQETHAAFNGMMSDLEFEALKQGREAVVAMDEKLFKQYSEYFTKK